MKKKVVIFGATSAIAIATARVFAEQNADFLLIARNKEKLESVQQDLQARSSGTVSYLVADLADSSAHQKLFEEINNSLPDYNTVLIAYGSLGSQTSDQENFDKAQAELDTNLISVVSLLTEIGNKFSKEKQGTIAVITSVAGDRGRKSNYIYGAAKGALTLLLGGLRNRLHEDNVHVLTVKPGFVDTPMTADMDKNFLFVQPEVVGEAICKAIDKRKDVIYVPWFWKYIMIIIKLIPESIFKRLSL